MLVGVAELIDGILADRGLAGEEGADSGSFATEPSQTLGVGHGIGPAAAELFGERNPQNVVLFGERDGLVVVAVLDVAKLFGGAKFAAKGVDVRQNRVGWVRRHGVVLLRTILRRRRPAAPGQSEEVVPHVDFAAPAPVRKLPKSVAETLHDSRPGSAW